MACDSLQGGHDFGDDRLAIDGFVLVKASGQSTYLGTDKPKASQKERPRMKVDFTYDYYIGDHEVTCKEYNDVIQDYYVEDGYLLPCSGPEWPMVNATFYDAIIYANGLSKKYGLDSVYTYLSMKFDSDGHCTDLEGLRFLPDANGFRLPTEAEWVYAASQGWNPKHGWTSEISDFTYHKVMKKPANQLNLYDMAGNLMEWVNDWYGYLKDTSLTNFVGSIDGGNFGERILKGGSFRNEFENVNLYSRSDIYMVTSASRAPYVGFRLARGAIPEPTWLSAGAAIVSASELLAGSNTVKKQTGSFRTKLAFRNDATGNLSYVDYSVGNLQIIEFQDSLDVYHPEFSPDGRKVAFCTTVEGVGGKSSVYVRDLVSSESTPVKLDVESAAIPRWRVLDNGDTVIVYVTDAGVNTDDAKFFSNSTWMVPFSKGKFGTPEKLFDGAYHGGISSDRQLAVTGARVLRAHSEGSQGSSDSIWFNGDQICNVSLNFGNDKRTLFLDFAGPSGRDYVGSRYAVHEYLFVADPSGKIENAIQSPDGYTFDHSEWVVSSGTPSESDEDLAVVSLTNENFAHDKIALVNLSTGNVTDLVKGDELWHPSLWRKKINLSSGSDVILALDSAGIYSENPVEYSEALMKVKMRMFWEMKDSLELVAVGSSRIEVGFDPFGISDYRAFNFGYAGSELWGELHLAKNYVLNHVKNLKVLVIELPLDLQTNGTEFMNDGVFEQAPGYIYDKNHGFWKNGLPEGFMDYVLEFQEYTDKEREIYVETKGLYVEDCVNWYGDEVDRDSVFTDEEQENYDEVLDSLDSFIDYTKDLGIKLVLMIYPQSPYYVKTGSFGRHGVKRSIAMETIDRYRKLEKKYKHLYFMDENKMGAHDYTDEYALDYDHLCYNGAKRITQRLDSLLKTFD